MCEQHLARSGEFSPHQENLHSWRFNPTKRSGKDPQTNQLFHVEHFLGGILSGISNQPLIQNARLGEYAEFTNFVVTPTFLVFFQPIDTFAAISGSMSALATPNS
jgi:hypothetical protein